MGISSIDGCCLCSRIITNWSYTLNSGFHVFLLIGGIFAYCLSRGTILVQYGKAQNSLHPSICEHGSSFIVLLLLLCPFSQGSIFFPSRGFCFSSSEASLCYRVALECWSACGSFHLLVVKMRPLAFGLQGACHVPLTSNFAKNDHFYIIWRGYFWSMFDQTSPFTCFGSPKLQLKGATCCFLLQHAFYSW